MQDPRMLRLSATVLAIVCLLCRVCAVRGSGVVTDADDTASDTPASSRSAGYVSYGEWNAWGFCTAQCLQYRRRACTSINEYLWPCRKLFQKQSCLTGHCPVRSPAVEAKLSALDCGRRRGQQLSAPVLRIFGGVESQPHSWPWHVSLIRGRGPGEQFCGGTLIHPQFVLTARHCVVSGQGFERRLYAVVGDHDKRARQPNERTHRVVKIRTHPGIRAGNLEFDVALLKLAEPVDLGDHVQVACLPRPSDRVSASGVNTMCIAIGFGRQGRGASDPLSQTLREAQLYLTDHEQCDNEYRLTNVRINPRSHVCAAAAGKDTCSGDSGGGLFCADQSDAPGSLERWHLFGITSFGHPLGCGYHSGVFQRTSILYDWVQSSITADLRDRRRRS